MRKALLAGASAGTSAVFLLWIMEWKIYLPLNYGWTFEGEYQRFLPALTAFGLALYVLLGAMVGALLALLCNPLRMSLPVFRGIRLRSALTVALLLAPVFWETLFLFNKWYLPHRTDPRSLVGNAVFLLLSLAIYAFLVWLAESLWSKDSARVPRRMALVLTGVPWALTAIVGAVAIVNWQTTKPRIGDIAAGEDRPNVVFFIIETTRWDHLGCYGYDRNTSPNIDAVAAEGLVFENFYTVAPISGISRASFHTGVYPQNNGVRTHPQKIRDDRTLVAEVFREAGYETAAFASGNMAGPEFGYHKGFRTYESWATCYDQFRFATVLRSVPLVLNTVMPWFKTPEELLALVDAGAGPKRAMEWIDTVGDAPFYIRFDLNEPHMTYVPPARFAEKFTEPYPEFSLVEESLGRYDIRYDFDSTEFTARDVQHTIGLYDAEIAYADDAIGRFMQGLRERGLAENTIIVITADHGESLGEHNLYFVHDQLYEQSLHVPMIISYPKALPAKRIHAVVNALDYFPTVVELAGLSFSGELEGSSMLAKLEADVPSGPIFAESNIIMEPRWMKYPYYRMHVPGVAGKWRMVRDGDYKLIYIPGPSGPEYELYDVRNDPAESINLVDEHPEIFERLHTLLEDWMAADDRGNEDLDPETLAAMEENLRALGYIQ